MAISYVLPIFFLMVVFVLHASAAEKNSSRKAEQKGDFFSHISCVVFVLHASAAEKPNRKVISSHIYPVYDSENQLQSLP
jgi:hypothetical protein